MEDERACARRPVPLPALLSKSPRRPDLRYFIKAESLPMHVRYTGKNDQRLWSLGRSYFGRKCRRALGVNIISGDEPISAQSSSAGRNYITPLLGYVSDMPGSSRRLRPSAPYLFTFDTMLDSLFTKASGPGRPGAPPPAADLVSSAKTEVGPPAERRTAVVALLLLGLHGRRTPAGRPHASRPVSAAI
ncbi:hypothetical protein EVAR_56164_1 [Eumeta japonica]|uniref:Uncharacterized protein n=1 Tax=Eumeta variegata TaxID=151549 RepID=A0A4C1Y7G6_EUMVA|nr:hypothetical protein EVAR_56164_1 [Eumeta japonica]